jgi:hypothetical protein
MQDRTSANSMKVLLQRAAGPYMWVIRVGPKQAATSPDVRFTSDCVAKVQNYRVMIFWL